MGYQQRACGIRIDQIDHVAGDREVDAPQREMQRAGQVPEDDGKGRCGDHHMDRIEEQMQRQFDEPGNVLRDALVRVVQAPVPLYGVVRASAGPCVQKPARHGGAPLVLLQFGNREEQHHGHQHRQHAGDPGQAQAAPDAVPIPLDHRIHDLARQLVGPDGHIDASEHEHQPCGEKNPATPAFARSPVGQD